MEVRAINLSFLTQHIHRQTRAQENDMHEQDDGHGVLDDSEVELALSIVTDHNATSNAVRDGARTKTACMSVDECVRCV
jgi:hypothetical protein